MEFDYVFDSEQVRWGSCEEKLELDIEKKPQVSVLFEKEGVILHADCHGNTVFRDTDGNEVYVEAVDTERLFWNIYVSVDEGKICVRFPATKWIDYYPNCDGEHDRWSEVIVDNFYVYCPLPQGN